MRTSAAAAAVACMHDDRPTNEDSCVYALLIPSSLIFFLYMINLFASSYDFLYFIWFYVIIILVIRLLFVIWVDVSYVLYNIFLQECDYNNWRAMMMVVATIATITSRSCRNNNLFLASTQQ